ncbi:MAG: GSCFA domain-containing protein [Prevotella sp.]|nr:GSCFA domain-containing protein [Prevotella sp.]
MLFRTTVEIEKPQWQIAPAARMLFVGSCFADRIGQRFAEEHFPVTVNPYGVMYNPASVLHTVERLKKEKSGIKDYDVAVLTLGTNHVYIEKATREIVDNCQKRPQSLFDEQELTVAECADYLLQAITLLHEWNPAIKIILTVSPIRYQKYGFHRSQLSKATLLLAIDELVKESTSADNSNHNSLLFTLHSSLYYFPSYEIVNDELRDYRFYNPDMLHPTDQTVEYIWQRLVETCFSDAARQYLEEWRPLKQALAHRPFHPESPEYQQFLRDTQTRIKAFDDKWLKKT